MINRIKKYYNAGWQIINDPFHIKVLQLDKKEVAKTPLRSDIINFLLVKLKRETTYLEIGVRNPADNYDKINSTIKYSVDPGIEYKENPDRKSTRLNSSHVRISYAVFSLKKKIII